MSKKNAEDNTTRCNIGQYTPTDSSEFLFCTCAQDIYVDQTVANRQHHKPNRRSDAAPNYATENLTTDTIYIQIVTVTKAEGIPLRIAQKIVLFMATYRNNVGGCSKLPCYIYISDK